ncbi:hypothetical protein PV10_05453 [Exophiala mesophila]|uniref:Uncharacterized protein n=1 Tax=Exophiala mesophila TaxID=212818 RepID=A0A0D1WP58_EXOME|nr:uncharacterized protein PV10_05453 [Exophiala mesophila]KIV90845.1 hypothetical protein PV10_05453 [Exophiala mesophila]
MTKPERGSEARRCIAIDRYFMEFPELKWLKEDPPTWIAETKWYASVVLLPWDDIVPDILSKDLAEWLLEPAQQLLRRCWAWNEDRLAIDVGQKFREIKQVEADPSFHNISGVQSHSRCLCRYFDGFRANSSDIHCLLNPTAD